MNKMLILLNRLDIEAHLSELREITKAHGITKVYLAKVSPEFGSRVRSIVAPHKLEMVARISEAAAGKYLSSLAESLREKGIDYEPIKTGIPVSDLDGFIMKNGIELVLTSDGRSGVSRWPSGSLIGRLVPSLYEHAFAENNVETASGEKASPYAVKKMLVLLNQLDVDSHLDELREIAKNHEIRRVYMASISPSAAGSQSLTAAEYQTGEQTKVYLVRVSRSFGSRIRSLVAPHKLDLAKRLGDSAASKYLAKIAETLSTKGVEAIPIGIAIPAEKIDEYVRNNNIDLVLIGNGRSGLVSWPSDELNRASVQSLYEDALKETAAIFELRKAKALPRLARLTAFVLQFSFLLAFWLVLSGHYNAKFISFGIVSAGLVTLMTNDIVRSVFCGKRASPRIMLIQLGRFLAYIPWLLREIVKANIQVAAIVLNPRMPIDPMLLRFKTRLRGHLAQVILANSITITPGSVTVDLENDTYTVHALIPGAISGAVDASLQNKVGAILGQKELEPPEVAWGHTFEELA